MVYFSCEIEGDTHTKEKKTILKKNENENILLDSTHMRFLLDVKATCIRINALKSESSVKTS